MKKAIVVSPVEYFQFFEQAFPEWDIQHPVESIDQLWNELGNETLDSDSEVVILNDVYHSEDSEQLELALITFASDALVLVIADPEYKTLIEQKISKIMVRKNIPSVSRIWFISREDPIKEINEAIKEYEAYVLNRVSEYVQPIQQEEPSFDTVNVENQGFSNANTVDYIEQVEHQEFPENYGTETNQVENNPYQQNPYANQEQPVYQEQHVQAQQTLHSSFAGDGYTGPERNGMIIASTSSKGGSGKSTVGICTASMIYHASRLASDAGEANRPLDVVIVDMDTRDGQIGFFLGESTPTILNVYTSQDFSRNNIARNLVYNERLGVHALLAPKRARTADYTTPDFYRDIINKLRTMFDVVLLDTSVNYTDPLIYDVILPVSDAVLFVTDMSKGAVFGMTRWIAEVTLPIDEGGSAAISKDKIGVVVNKSMGNVGFDQRNLVEAASGVPLIASIPMDSTAVLGATNNNHLDDIVLRHPVLSPAYYALAAQIIQNSVPIKSPTEDIVVDNGKGKVDPLKGKAPAKKRKLFGR